LAGDTYTGSFDLKDVLKYDRDVQVGKVSGRDMLVLHAISSLMLEGGVPPNPRFVVYPSHTPGKLTGPLAEYLEPLSKTFHGFYRDDLLVRVSEARDTSLARAYGDQGAPVSIEDQMKTVCIAEAYRNRLQGRHVIVFDDFTTTGASLEWARNLLLAAGAEGVTLMTVGKYGTRYEAHVPKTGIDIDPFNVELRPRRDVFDIQVTYLLADMNAVSSMQALFERQKKPKN
jgi:hypothetical protein